MTHQNLSERGIVVLNTTDRGDRQRTGRVLAVASCAVALSQISRVLRERGFEVDIADSVDTALAFASDLRPDSVLLESQQFQPELCRRLQERFGVPVIKFTSRRSQGELHAMAAAVMALAGTPNPADGESDLPPLQLEQAREIQANLMPSDLPRVHGWEVQFDWQPARAVGGDLCWFAQRECGLLVALADVQGKGFPAAMLVGLMGALLDQVQTLDEDVLRSLNEHIAARTPDDVSIALTLFQLCGESQTVRYCNAGNPPPVVLGQGSLGWDEVQPAMGWLPEYEYQLSIGHLEPGQVLAAHSDGLESDLLATIEPSDDLADLVARCLVDAEASHPDDRAIIVMRRW